MFQTCLLSAFALSPTFELFKSLELCCKDVVEWPPVCPVSPGKGIDPEKYAQLLDAVNLLRDVPKYRPTPAGWQLLKPVLVARFEEAGGRFRTAESKYVRTMARRSVRPTKSVMARSPSSAAKRQRKLSDTVQDLCMSVTGDDVRDTGKQSEMHAESTVTVENTGINVDDVTKADSAAVEDDAASDITIVTSDIDNDEFRKLSVDDAQQKVSQDVSDQVMNVDNTEDKSTWSVQQPLNDDGLSSTVASMNDFATDVSVGQNCSETESVTDCGTNVTVEQKYSETENVVNDTADHILYGDFFRTKDAVPQSLEVTDRVDSVKDEVAATVEESSEMFHLFESQTDVNKTSENIAETAGVTDEFALQSDVLLSSKDYPESETAENECVTSLNLLPSAENIAVADSDETQNIGDSVDAVDISAHVSSASYLGTEEEAVTSDKIVDAGGSDVVLPIISDSTVALSDCMQSLDLHHSSHLVDEGAAVVNIVQPEPESTETSSVNSGQESPQKLSMETGLACVDDITEPALGDLSGTDAAGMLTTEDAAEMLTSNDVGGKSSANGETVDSVVADSKSSSETSVSSHMQDAVGEKGRPSVTGNSPVFQTIRLSGDVTDVKFARCSVSLYRIPVSDSSRNTVNVVPSNECSKLQRRCSVVLKRLSPSLEPSTQSMSSAAVPTGLCCNKDDAVNMIVISDGDELVELLEDGVPETLAVDDQSHSVPAEMSAIDESVPEVMSKTDIVETESNHMERQPGIGSKAVGEAECSSSQDLTSAGVNSSAILEHREDKEEKMSVDIVPTACSESCDNTESSLAVSENMLYSDIPPDNSESTDTPSDPLESADLVSWRPLLSLAAEIISETDSSQEPRTELEGADVNMSHTLDAGDKVDLLAAAAGLTEEEAVIVTEDSPSCDVIEHDAVEASTDINVSPGFLPNDETTDTNLRVPMAEYAPTTIAVDIVTDQLEFNGSVVADECARAISTCVSNVETSRAELSGNDTDVNKCDENDDSDVVVCDPFPIFSECRTHSGIADSLKWGEKLEDNTRVITHGQSTDRYAGSCVDELREDTYALIVSPDVPEPSDEVDLCTTGASTQSSSEVQSEADCEDYIDANWTNRRQSVEMVAADIQDVAGTASDVDVSISDSVIGSSNSQTLCSESVTAAGSSMCLNFEPLHVVNVQHPDDKKLLDTESMAGPEAEVDRVISELPGFPVACSLQDTGSFKVQKETEECTVREQLEQSVGQNSSTLTCDVSTGRELNSGSDDFTSSQLSLPACLENRQETLQEVAGENKTVSAMLVKLGAVCKNVSQKGQFHDSELTTREGPHRSVMEKPVCESSSQLPSTVTASPSYVCPYCSQTFSGYTAYINHLRAESARHAVKSTLAASEQGKRVQETSAQADMVETATELEVVAKSTKTRCHASSTTGRSQKPALNSSRVSVRGSEGNQLDAAELVHQVPAKSHSSSAKLPGLTGNPQKQGSDATISTQAKSKTSEFATPIPGKSRHHSLPRSLHINNPPASTCKTNKRKLSLPQNSDDTNVGGFNCRTGNQQSQKEMSSRPVAAKSSRNKSTHSVSEEGKLLQETATEVEVGAKSSKVRRRASSATGKSQKPALTSSQSSDVTAEGKQLDAAQLVHEAPAKSRSGLSKSSGSTGKPHKQSLLVSEGSDLSTKAKPKTSSGFSILTPGKSRRHSLPKSLHKSKPSASAAKSRKQKLSEPQNSNNDNGVGGLDGRTGNQQSQLQKKKSSQPAAGKSHQRSTTKDSSTLESKSKSRRSVACVESDVSAVTTVTARKRLSSASSAHDAKKNKR